MFGGSNEIYAGIPLVETGILAPGTDIIQTFNDALDEIGIQRKTMKFINHRRVPFVAEVAVSRILIHSEPCLLLQIHDIDEIHRAHDAVTRANRQLSLLSSITRHDITNKLMVILGYINLIEKKFADPALAEYFLPIKSATSAIRSQIEFTKVYQDLGTHEPQWQEPDKHRRHLQIPDTVRVNADVQAIEIYADPMLEKVFFNILDNSIRHGERVTEIRVTSQQSESELAIVVEDNGIGILPEDKENIFQRGFGKNTGLGLFLIREILSITGISIRETGKYEEGARFEILIPPGKWRFRPPEMCDGRN